MLLGAVTYNVLKDMDLETLIKTLEAAGFRGRRTAHQPQARRRAVARRSARGSASRPLRALQSPPAQLRHHLRVPLARRGGARAERRPKASAGSISPTTPAPGASRSGPTDSLPRCRPGQTIKNIAACLRELGDYGDGRGVEIWMEVHGRETQVPPVSRRHHAGHQTPEGRAVLELQSHGRRQRQRQAELRSAQALDQELPHQRTGQPSYP